MLQRFIVLSIIYSREKYEVNKLYETIQTRIISVYPLFRSIDHHEEDLYFTRKYRIFSNL